MKILVTGGAGYLGSHTTLLLLQAAWDVVVLDNLCNSTQESLHRVTQLAGAAPLFVQGDVRDAQLLDDLFTGHKPEAVLHFAGLKAVGESVAQPLSYYSNNVQGTLVLLEAMQRAGINKLVFSSSATVYGEPTQMPIAESCPLGRPTNPYGRTKLLIEEMLRDAAEANPNLAISVLRYFNPVGAHSSGLIGEDPRGIPNNLLPFIAQVAVGKRAELSVFGSDYPTPDGTGVRDYIHVMDLAEGHLKALDKQRHGVQVWNLGTGQGYSVLEMLHAFEKASGRKIPFKVSPRRPGDIATCFADPTKAQQDLGWQATRGLTQMMQDAWRWQMQNPDGYR